MEYSPLRHDDIRRIHAAAVGKEKKKQSNKRGLYEKNEVGSMIVTPVEKKKLNAPWKKLQYNM